MSAALNITQPLTLQGYTLKNRLIKGAMSEALSNTAGKVTPELLKLYETWAQGGLGCSITGNVMIDIRAKKKFETGYIQGSRNIPFTELKDRIEEIRAIEQPVIIVCDMGIQAGAAVQMIGKDNVYRLDGGIGGWQGAGMPLVGLKDTKSKNKGKAKPSLHK